jgi:hypothetical protein
MMSIEFPSLALPRSGSKGCPDIVETLSRGGTPGFVSDYGTAHPLESILNSNVIESLETDGWVIVYISLGVNWRKNDRINTPIFLMPSEIK